MKLKLTVFPALLLIVALTSIGAEKYSAADYETAYRFLEASGVPENLEKNTDQMLEMQLNNAPQLLPYKEIFSAFFKKHLSYAKLKKSFAEIYLESFTPAQLAQLTAFYNSPLGKLLAQKTPELTIRGAALGQQTVKDNAAELQANLIKAVAEKKKAEAPSKQPAPDPPAKTK